MRFTLTNHIVSCCMLTMTILHANGQNVGIGTATPAFKLDVNGRMRVKTGTIGNVSTSSGIWLEDYRDGTNRMFIGMQDSIRAGFYGSGPGGVGWGFNFNATTGNVGIGRVATSSRLEVDDPNGGDIGFYRDGSFSGRLIATDTTLQLYSTFGNSFCIPNPCPSKDLILQPPGNIFNGTYSGNVGIGTNSPTAKLQIINTVMIGSGTPAAGYALSVNGKIVSEELKVQNSNNWPDYVFHNDYTLPSIDYMKKFIQKNQHLINIPSAKEVAREGINVGDMQKRMMEKIEELSLYIIQLHERIKKLETEASGR